MMKSFLCRLRILCVHQVTPTLPHSVVSRGWWPSFSASSPTSSVKAMASLKFLNLKLRSSLGMPSSATIRHSGICGCNSLISSVVTDGAPTRQATHFWSVSSSISLFLHRLSPLRLQLRHPFRSKLLHRHLNESMRYPADILPGEKVGRAGFLR